MKRKKEKKRKKKKKKEKGRKRRERVLAGRVTLTDPPGQSLSIVQLKGKKRKEEGCSPYNRATHSAELRRVSQERSRDGIPAFISLIIFYYGFGVHNGIDYLIGQRSRPRERVQRENSPPIVQHCE